MNSWLHKANELEEFRPLYLLYNLVNLFYEGYLIIMENFNSAKRLLNILQDCKNLEASPLSAKEAWKKVFNIQDENDVLLFSRIGKLMQLEQDVLNDIQEYYPHLVENQKQWTSQLNTAFSRLNFQEKFNKFTSLIDVHIINYLSMASDLLATKEYIKIEINELEKFKNEIIALIEEVFSSEINIKVKHFIIKNLNELLSAIEEFNITGVEPIFEKIESFVGHALYDKNYKEVMSKQPVGQKIWGILNAFAVMFTLANEIPKLPDTMSKAVHAIEQVIDADIEDSTPSKNIINITHDAIKEES